MTKPEWAVVIVAALFFIGVALLILGNVVLLFIYMLEDYLRGRNKKKTPEVEQPLQDWDRDNIPM